ncbi:UpxY family transcription antiterminator [Bacteroides stercoris]|jgi:transcriptional antiterminator NusG|uniref:UpxY family transcription antiterminator n=1 Tax=Bacteroides stercoris TaxID=46506 RepID=A0A3E4USB8_BACSE|nr:UpxY family transcription antiterminator [Bacteroides stercoris]RGM14982.1 UpxY family transcription antiterminator [Bacteroides stercoris]
MQNTNHIETKTNTASRQWLVAYVQSCLEKKTAQRLAAMGIECYLPVQSEIRQWSDRRKRVDRLVIPMMIFVHVTPQERPLPLSLQAVSRYMVLRGESTPAVIPDEQMDRFRFMLDYSPEAVEMCSAPLAPGDAVKVIKGPLAGLEGELITVNGKSKVAVRLDMLGCAHVDVPIGFVEKKGEEMEGQKNKKTKETQNTKEIQKRRQQEEKAVR